MKKAIPHNLPKVVCLLFTDSKLICYLLYRAGIKAKAALIITSMTKVALIDRNDKQENCNAAMLSLLLYGVVVPSLNSICLRYSR